MNHRWRDSYVCERLIRVSVVRGGRGMELWVVVGEDLGAEAAGGGFGAEGDVEASTGLWEGCVCCVGEYNLEELDGEAVEGTAKSGGRG